MGVLRDTARTPQPTTNQPTGHQWAGKAYMCICAYFGAKMAVLGPNILTILTKRSGTHISVCSMRLLVRIVLLVGHGTKWIIKANIWPKMTKMFILGQIWPFLGIHICEAKNADPGIYSFVYGRFALHRKCLVCEGLTFACSALPWSKKLLRWTFLGKKFRKQPTN